MDTFLKSPADQRRIFCEQAEVALGLPAASIEKDFWMCWTLRKLYALPTLGQYLTFKGGTSLSKAWHLIERFSEDIDLVIDRGMLGFGPATGPECAPSVKQQRKRLDELKAACQRHITNLLLPAFRARIGQELHDEATWSLRLADAGDDPDLQTLLFDYPSVFIKHGTYLRSSIRIEFGARSDTEPVEPANIQPYLNQALPAVLGQSNFTVRTVAARRTFWEKAMLLHEETFRPSSKPRKVRLARHYYDLWCLIRKGVADQAIADAGLFERIARHRAIFFNWSWVDYSTLRPGALRLLPLTDQHAEWKKDYDAMRGTMFFGDEPDFDEMLAVVAKFEQRFNESVAR
jgi:hypothetical protein